MGEGRNNIQSNGPFKTKDLGTGLVGKRRGSGLLRKSVEEGKDGGVGIDWLRGVKEKREGKMRVEKLLRIGGCI